VTLGHNSHITKGFYYPSRQRDSELAPPPGARRRAAQNDKRARVDMARDGVSVISAEPALPPASAPALTTRMRHLAIVALLVLAGALAWSSWQGQSEGPALAATPIGVAVLACLIAAFVSYAACWAIVRFQHLHAHLTLDAVDTGPQKFHTQPTPRVGGIGLALGLLSAYLFLLAMRGDTPTVHAFGLLLLCGIPAFAGGLIEDLTKKVGVTDRLLLTMLSGAMAAWLLDAVLNRVGIPGVDGLFAWGFVAIPFTVFAVGGIANAINIIDGYNGLVAGYAIIVLLAFAWVAHQVNDTLITIVALTLAAAIAGFMRWNWPGGKIFLGDGGAYFLGYLLAEISVLMVVRHPQVSPFFPLLLLIYPVFETVFSIYRKRLLRGQSPGTPDGLHMHMLLYKRVVPREWRGRENPGKLRRNSMIAKYVWIPAVAYSIAAVSASSRGAVLVVMIGLFVCAYVLAYRKIVRFSR
jgi:UDP-N-acetylmuramyl pentapeptide phosphotransferase/UDP-N-acetylglucosamine-1-phosphate transferase